MDRKMQKVIRVKIGEILTKNCDDCEKRLGDAKNCVGCPVYDQLREYGTLLYGKPQSKPPVVASKLISKDQLIELLDQDIKYKDIEKMYGLTRNAVRRLIVKWKLEDKYPPKEKQKHELTKELYISERNKGYTDYGIMKKHKVLWRSLLNCLKRWELENFEPNWTKPPVLNKETFDQLKELGWKNIEIDALYGLERRQRERIIYPSKVAK